MSALIDLDATLTALDAVGVPARLEHTGGGVFVLYAGHAHTAEPGDTRYAAACGPLYADGDRFVFDTSDAYVGLDDRGDTDPHALADVGATRPEHVAALLAAQVALVPTDLAGRVLTAAEARAAVTMGPPTVPLTGGTGSTGHDRHAPEFVASCPDCIRGA